MSWINDEIPDWVKVCFGRHGEESSLIVANPALLDLHLSYSAGLRNGPVIIRDGKTPPSMEDLTSLDSYTTDPELQRVGSYYITEEKKNSHIPILLYRFAGTYIIYGHIAGIMHRQQAGSAKSRDIARQEIVGVWSNDFPEQNFPLPPSYTPKNLGRLDPDILDFICKEFGDGLRKNPDYKDYESALNDAINTLKSPDPEFEKSQSDFINNMVSLANNQSYSLRPNAEKYLKLFISSLKTPSHEKVATDKNLGEIVLMQGCGDLTMNEWNVAFVSGDSYNIHEGTGRNWALLQPFGEPLNDRHYSCLIKWKCDKESLKEIAQKHRIVYPYQIARLYFRVPALDTGKSFPYPNRHVFLYDEEPIGHLIEFAVYGQQLIRERREVPLESIIREFSDIRHIYKLPNLNPNQTYPKAKDKGLQDYETRPRNIFNCITYNDIWLGEAALIQGDRNLRVAALKHAIQINIKDLGAPEEWIELVLRNSDYSEISSYPESPGQWRFIKEGRNMWLEIFLLRNQYPCSMIGIKAKDQEQGLEQQKSGIVDTKEIFFLTHGHQYTTAGCTISEAAEYLIKHGAFEALMFDEGQDVFQLVRGIPKVPLKREQLRCVFWATEREPNVMGDEHCVASTEASDEQPAEENRQRGDSEKPPPPTDS